MIYPQYPISSLENEVLLKYKQGSVLIEAEPGAGKSTLVPLWVLENTAADKKVILVQPRVLAAQAIASRLADLIGEVVGKSIGYRVAYDTCTSSQTRMEVVTPGVLVQQLLQNPLAEELECIILDEVHERSEAQDLLWVMLQEIRILRPELRVIAMSATPDPQWHTSVDFHLLAQGRCFPVSTQYCSSSLYMGNANTLAEDILRATESYKLWRSACVLVFLPGWREIEAAYNGISRKYPEHKIYRLHSQIEPHEQRLALDETQGPRIILSTNVAETSITIPDVTLVIDSGLAKRVDYEQKTGVSRLRLGRISQASADQRRGRAGRVQAGHCIRLWSEADQLAAADLPEIRNTDLLPLALRLAYWQEWGSDPKSLPWLEKPNLLAVEQAFRYLAVMGFVIGTKITAKGKQVIALGTHPRIASLLLNEFGVDDTLLLLALALHFEWLAEGDLGHYLATANAELQRNRRWQTLRKRWRNQLRTAASAPDHNLILAQAFPDRIGALQESKKYRLNSGISVSPWASLQQEWAVFPVVSASAKHHHGLAVPLAMTVEQLKTFSQKKSQLVKKADEWFWSHEWFIGGEVVDTLTSSASEEQVVEHLLAELTQKIYERGLGACITDGRAAALWQRALLAQRQTQTPYPNLEEQHLTQGLSQWLLPFLAKNHSLNDLPWLAALEFYLGYEGISWLDSYLPALITLPSGRQIHPEINTDGEACVSAKLQEFFGCESLSWGKSTLQLRIELLSPNGSSLAITRDLKNFWQNAYKEVCKEMRGRYPRHPWPDNPMEHAATSLTKKKLQQQTQ